MAWKTLDDMSLSGKRVLTRVDINVPVEENPDGTKTVTDATRIDRIIPTLKDILAKGGRPVMLAHFGRPKVNEMNPAYSVDKLRPALAQALIVALRAFLLPAHQSLLRLYQALVLRLFLLRLHPAPRQ